MKKQTMMFLMSIVAVMLVISLSFQPILVQAAEQFPTYQINGTVPTLKAGKADIAGSAFVDKDGEFHWLYSFAGYETSDTGGSWVKYNSNTDMGALNANWGTAITSSTYWNRPGTIGYKIDETYGIPTPYKDDHNDPIGVWIDPATGYWYALVNDEYQFSPFSSNTNTDIDSINSRVASGIHNNRILSCYSTDKGVTWQLIGQVATSPWNDSNEAANNTNFPGSTWSYGVAGCRLFIDNVNGYFYLLYNNHINWKPGYSNVLTYFHLARSPISAKMAEGSWDVWDNGKWTKSALKGYAGWIGSPMGPGSDHNLTVNYTPGTDSLTLTGIGMDGSSLNISYTKIPSGGDFTFKDLNGNTYTANVVTGIIKDSSGSSIPAVFYSDPALDSTVTISIVNSKVQIKQENNKTGYITTVTPNTGNPVFKNTETQRLFVPVNTQYENAFSYNVYTGKYQSVGYDGYVYETDDLGAPDTFKVVGKLPSTAGSYVSNLDPGSLTNQQVSSYSFRMISDLSGTQNNYNLTDPGAGQTYYSTYNPPKDSSGAAISPSTAYTISIGGTSLKDGSSDKWQFVPVPDEFDPSKNSGFYRLQNISTGEYLKVSGTTAASTRAMGATLTYGSADPNADPNGNNGNGSPCGSDQWYLLPVGNATPTYLTPSSSTGEIAAACNTSVNGINTYRLVNRTSALAVEFTNSQASIQSPKFGAGNHQVATITPAELPTTTLSVPTGFSANAAGISQINVSWDTYPEATGYDLLVDGVLLSDVTSPYVHTGLAESSTHSYQVRAKNSTGTSLWSLLLSATTKSTLVSQGKPATASTEQVSGGILYSAGNANDGSGGTRWAAADSSFPQWWKVDLGTSCYINKLESNWFNHSQATRYYKYEIYGSNDDVNYSLILDRNDNTTQDLTTDTFSAVARYVKIKVTGSSSSSAMAGAYEFKVYGVDKIPLSISGLEVGNKEYDGTTAGTINTSNTVLAGVKPGEDVAVDYSNAVASFSDKNAGTGKTVTISGLKLKGNNAENYILVNQDYTTTANIYPKTVHATGIIAENKPYDGTTVANLIKAEATLNSAEIITNENVSLNVDSAVGIFESADIGTGKNVTVTGLSLTGNDAGNYALAPYTITADITAQQDGTIIVTGVTAASKVYDGTTSAQINIDNAKLIGVADEDKDNVSLVTTGAAGTFADKNIGENKTVIVNGLSLSGPAASKYTLGSCAAVANITPKTISASGITALSKPYDGNNNVALSTTSATLNGVVAGETVTLDTSGIAGTFNDANPGAGKIVEVTGLKLTGSDAGNYILDTYTTTANILIGIDVTGITALNKVYDGKINATLDTSAAILSGVADGDSVSLDMSSAAGVFTDKNAGSGKTVSVSGLALSGKDSGKYILNNPYTTTADITQKPLAVSGVTADNKVYDGAVAATIHTEGATISAGVIPGDAVMLNSSNATGAFDDSDAGAAKTITVRGFRIEGTDAKNYLFSGECIITAAIVPILDGANAENRVQVKPQGVTVTATSDSEETSKGNTAGKAIDNSMTTRWAAADSNYPHWLKIDLGRNCEIQKVVSYWFNSSTDRAYKYKIEISNDDITYTKVADRTTNTISSGSSAPLTDVFYPTIARYVKITATGSTRSTAQPSIYEAQILGSKLPALTVTGITADSKVYDGTASALLNTSGAVLSGVNSGDTVSLNVYQAVGTFDNKNVGNGKIVNVTGLTLTGADAGKYVLPLYATTADITEKPISAFGIIVANKIWNGETDATINTNGAALSGIVPGDTVSLDVYAATGAFNDMNIGLVKVVTVSGLTLSGADAVNYILSQYTTTANILPEQAQIVKVEGITADSKEYDGTTAVTLNTSGAVLSGVKSGDTVTLNVYQAAGTFDNKNTGNGKTITVSGLRLDGADAWKYTLDTCTTTADISPKAVYVTGITADNKDYDATTTATLKISDAALNGVITGDTVTLDVYAAKGTFDNSNTGVGKIVTVSGLTLSGADAGNYILNQYTTTADINPRSNNGGSIPSNNGSTGNPTVIVDKDSGAIKATPVLNNDTANVILGNQVIEESLSIVKQDIDGFKKIYVEIEKLDKANSYNIQLPSSTVTSEKADRKIVLITPAGKVELPGNMYMANQIKENDKISFSVGMVDVTKLPVDLRSKIGERPVFEITAKINDNVVEWNNAKAPVTISIDYKPSQDELKDSEHIVVWYIDNQGRAVPVPNGKYDPATGKVTFTTTHFSKYAVAFVKKTFNDINDFGWAKNQIEVMASKGVINGTSDTTFEPDRNITRADFIMLLTKALSLKAESTSNFSDVSSSDYYYEALGTAKKLGITEGTGDNKFNPNEQISRQDMMVLTAKALKLTGKISSTGSADDIRSFADAMSVANYAVEGVATLIKEGIIQGDGNNINPEGSATRAEIAVLIYRLYNK